jgi:hypothetical protein
MDLRETNGGTASGYRLVTCFCRPVSYVEHLVSDATVSGNNSSVI